MLHLKRKPLMVCILITTKDRKKAAQNLVGDGLGGILPANLNYQHPKGGSDPEVGSHPAAKPLNQQESAAFWAFFGFEFYLLPSRVSVPPTCRQRKLLVRSQHDNGYP